MTGMADEDKLEIEFELDMDSVQEWADFHDIVYQTGRIIGLSEIINVCMDALVEYGYPLEFLDKAFTERSEALMVNLLRGGQPIHVYYTALCQQGYNRVFQSMKESDYFNERNLTAYFDEHEGRVFKVSSGFSISK